MPDKEIDLGRKAAQDVPSAATSDNRYQARLDFYTTHGASLWVGVTQRRVRQLAREHSIGKRDDANRLIFTFEEVTIMGKLTRKGRLPVKNVSPRNDPDALLSELDNEKARTILRQFWTRLSNQVLMAFHQHTEAMYYRIDKTAAECQREWRNMDYELREAWAAIHNIEKHLGIDPQRKRKEHRGRGVPNLAVRTPLTLIDHADRAA